MPGRPTNLDKSRARAYCACSMFGWELSGHFFSSLSFLFLFSLSLGDGPVTEILSQRAFKPKTTYQPIQRESHPRLLHVALNPLLGCGSDEYFRTCICHDFHLHDQPPSAPTDWLRENLYYTDIFYLTVLIFPFDTAVIVTRYTIDEVLVFHYLGQVWYV